MAVRKPCSCGRGKPDVLKETRITRSGRKVTYQVGCPRCGLYTKKYKNEKDAIAEWNRRAEDGR